MADRPLRPAKDLWLGVLLPHQLPNPTQAYLVASYIFDYLVLLLYTPKSINSLTLVKYNYSRLLGKFSRVTHPFATQAKRLAFDSHVLSIPQAFIRSQDQTLFFKN